MDKKIQEILEEKIHRSTSVKNEITSLVNSLEPKGTGNNLFAYGIIIGRLYNSFYYQSRRVLKRDPTQQEFSEFTKFLEDHRNVLSDITSSIQKR
jgi:hypothetical protein